MSLRRTRELQCCDAATVIAGTVDPWSCRLPESGEVFLQSCRLDCTNHYTKTNKKYLKKPPRGSAIRRSFVAANCRGLFSVVLHRIDLGRASLTRHPQALWIVFVCIVCCRYEGCNMMQLSINACHASSKLRLCIYIICLC